MPHYTREISRTLDCGPGPRIDIRTVSGAVKVRGEERHDVHITATVRFRANSDEEADELMRAVEEGIRGDGDHAVIHSPNTETGSLFGAFRHVFGPHRHVEIDVEVNAPTGSSLALHHVNGGVDVRGLGGEARLQLVNGRFEVEDIGGDLTVRHVNGRGLARNVAGSVEVHHTNGALDVERAGGDVQLRLVNGSVDVLNPGGSVSIKGVSGAYTLTGAVRGNVSVNNAHGNITLQLPRESRFQLDAQSAMGSVTSELEIRHDEAGEVEAPKVSLRSETGRIELRRLRQTEPAAV